MKKIGEALSTLSTKRKQKTTPKGKSPVATTPPASPPPPKWTRKQREKFRREEGMPFDRSIDSWSTTHSWAPNAEENADDFMKRYSDMGVEGIKYEFRSEVEGYRSPTFSDKAFQANPTKNLNKDLPLLDESRVELKGKKYYHASWAYDKQRLGRQYILCQAPQSHTIADWWQMIYEQKVVCVFLLNERAPEEPKEPKPEDKDKPSFVQLWPTKEGEVLEFGKISVLRHEWSVVYQWRGSELVLSQKGSKEKHGMFCMHIINWEYPTFGRQSALKMLRILGDMNLLESERETGPFLLCDDDSGTSRASILLVADAIGTLLFKGEKDASLVGIVKWARRCRHGAIRNDEDYLAVVKVVLEQLWDTNTETRTKYKEQYEKICGKLPEKPKPVPRPDKIAPSADKVGPNADKVGPSADKVGPSADKVGPSAEKIVPSGEKIDEKDEKVVANTP